MDSLTRYREKRDFNVTSEPAPKKINGKKQGWSFCIQKHEATRLHYDFRLELDGVLKSWAVTKGPSISTSDRRLAIHVEDHPLDYGDFEGTIPKGEYGGGTVMLWDRGTWEPVTDPHKGLKEGHMKFIMHGERVKGHYALVRMKPRDGEKQEAWLLIKEKDEFAKTGATAEKFLDKNSTSIKTGRKMEEIAEGTTVWRGKAIEEKKVKKKIPAAVIVSKKPAKKRALAGKAAAKKLARKKPQA